jgi:hypothetical protein
MAMSQSTNFSYLKLFLDKISQRFDRSSASEFKLMQSLEQKYNYIPVFIFDQLAIYKHFHCWVFVHKVLVRNISLCHTINQSPNDTTVYTS